MGTSVQTSPFSQLLAIRGHAGLEARDTLGVLSPKQVQRQISRRIVQKKRPPASPDSPYGLSRYFAQAFGTGNTAALCKTFSDLLKSGEITPHQARAMVDRFAFDWKRMRHTQPPWQVFIGRRYQLMEKTRDKKQEEHSKWAAMQAKYL